MHNRSAVFADPTAWLPWTYLETLQAMEQPVPLNTAANHRPSLLFWVAVPQ